MLVLIDYLFDYGDSFFMSSCVTREVDWNIRIMFLGFNFVIWYPCVDRTLSPLEVGSGARLGYHEVGM